MDCVYAAPSTWSKTTKLDQGPSLDQYTVFDMDQQQWQGKKWLDPTLDLILISISEEWLMLCGMRLHIPLKTVVSIDRLNSISLLFM